MKKKKAKKKKVSNRKVISKCYCLPPSIVNWIESLAQEKEKIQGRNISASSILNDMLIGLKNSVSN